MSPQLDVFVPTGGSQYGDPAELHPAVSTAPIVPHSPPRTGEPSATEKSSGVQMAKARICRYVVIYAGLIRASAIVGRGIVPYVVA